MSNKLFDDNSDEENKDVLPINKNYAEKYEKWRKKEEYERLKAKYGVKDFDSENSGSEESEDEEYVEPDNPEFDMDFFRVLAAIRTKHPILEKKKKFFKDSYQSETKEKEEKPLLIVDYERKRLLESGGKYGDDLEEVKPGSSRAVKKNKFLSNSKGKFKFDDNLSDNEDAEDLFIKKGNSESSMEDQGKESEAIDFLQGKKEELTDKVDEELLCALKRDWKSNMSKEDKFLMDYFVNKRYLEEEDESKERADNHYAIDFEPLEEDEETFNKMEEYEAKYRFRFEEPDQEFIRGHPRVLDDIVRKRNTRRREEREKKRNMMREEEERKKQELIRLKAFKKQEIIDRIEMLKEAAGIENSLDPKNFDLEADFDPEKHDALMSQVFSDQYYNEEAEKEKPKFEDEELQRELEEEYEKLKDLDNMTEGNYKYVEVVSNSYGLSTEEILFAKDTELNRWCSINRVLKYGQRENEEKKMKINFAKRGENEHVKYKILPSLFSENIEEHWEAEEDRRRKRNLKKKERKKKKMTKMQEDEMSVPSKINSENADASAENQADLSSVESSAIEKEELDISDSAGDLIETENSFLKDRPDSPIKQQELKENSKISEKKRKRKKKQQKLNDSNKSTGSLSEVTLEAGNLINSEGNSNGYANYSPKEKVKTVDKTFENITNAKNTKKRKGKNLNENCVLNSSYRAVNCEKNSQGKYSKISKEKEAFAINKSKISKKKQTFEINKSITSTKMNKKRKTKEGNDDDKNESSKKPKLSKEKLETRNQLEGISDARFLAYGQNPKKIKRSLKYSARFN